MNSYLQLGTTIVVFALIAYSFAIYTEQRKRIINKRVLVFLTLGVGLDITATVLMILGSGKGGFTLHGFLGYSALLGMFIDAVLIWRKMILNGMYSPVPKQIHLYSVYAYFWWVAAFITGGLLVALR